MYIYDIYKHNATWADTGRVEPGNDFFEGGQDEIEREVQIFCGRKLYDCEQKSTAVNDNSTGVNITDEDGSHKS